MIFNPFSYMTLWTKMIKKTLEKKTTWIRGGIKSLPFSFLTHLTNLLTTLQQTHAYTKHGITWYFERYFTWLHVGSGLTSGVHTPKLFCSFLSLDSLSHSHSSFREGRSETLLWLWPSFLFIKRNTPSYFSLFNRTSGSGGLVTHCFQM